jgi:hypothetical protein
MSLRDWLRRLVEEVPPEDAVCEFRCHKTACRRGEWERCLYRLRNGLPPDLSTDPPQERPRRAANGPGGDAA